MWGEKKDRRHQLIMAKHDEYDFKEQMTAAQKINITT